MRKLHGGLSDSESPLLRQFRFRHLDPFRERWSEIERYNASIAAFLPEGAKTLVLSDWHYNASDRRCPHDSWIQSIEITPNESKTTIERVQLRLLGAYHDRLISLSYLDVSDCSIHGQLVEGSRQNLDWLYDEVHLLDSGRVEHLIEFEACVMRIESADLVCEFTAVESPR